MSSKERAVVGHLEQELDKTRGPLYLLCIQRYSGSDRWLK
jgi:hypothetical protein